jgi:hypothetical protein
MIYLGGNWPEKYRGQFFTSNTHGRRILFDRLERNGSGYVGKHVKDPFMLANDQWFRGVDLAYGPDGAVYVSDWNDLGECHDHDGTLRSSGRIYKVAYGKSKASPAFDLQKNSDAELVALLSHANEWQRRHAQRILHERAASGTLLEGTPSSIRELWKQETDVPQKLRYLWAGYIVADALGKPTAKQLGQLLKDDSEHVRWWAVQLLMNHGAPPQKAIEGFAEMARTDTSPLVRLAVASTLHRLPIDSRWEIAEALLSHADDSEDPNLPLIIWHGIEPAIAKDRTKAVQLLAKCKIQKVRQFITRRMTAP